MKHEFAVRRYLYLLTALLAITSATGCSILATAMWVVNPNDVNAEFDGLKDQTVAVVCRPEGNISYQTAGVPESVATQVGTLLDENVSKVKLIDPTTVNDWLDEHDLESYVELGRGVGADMVVALDISDFRMHKGPTMLQGQSTVDVAVYDVATGKLVKQLETVDSVFPPGNGIPIEISDDRFESRFQRRFVEVLSHQIARRFFAHDSRGDVAMERFFKEP